MAKPSLSLLKPHFDILKTLLNPTQNPQFPSASQAYHLILNAWSILSDPDQESTHTQGLGDNDAKVDTFWTICPYCYHVYEYLKCYEGYCLRCQYGKCGKAFHGVALGMPPPEKVVEKGEYDCSGFVVLNGQKVENVWNPFSLLGSFPCGEKDEETKGMEDGFIQISDDEIEEDGDLGNERESFQGNVENMEVDCGVKLEEKNMMGKEEIAGQVETEQGGCNGRIICGKRIKKSVPITSRKIMGKGVRVKRNEVMPMQSVENLGCGGGDMSNVLNLGTETGDLEFNILDDDIFVSLQDVVVPTV